MRFPSIKQIWQTALKKKSCGYVVYLCDPESTTATMAMFEGTVNKEGYEKIKAVVQEVLNSTPSGHVHSASSSGDLRTIITAP